MQYRSFGRTGLQLSALGFGVMRIPDDETGRPDQKLADRLIRTAVERGVNYFDTAQNYMNGHAEALLAQALNGLRDKVHIATKVGNWHLKGNGIADVEQHLAGQLQRLNTDYIDCYLLHSMDEQRWAQLEAVGILDWLTKQKQAGTIGHVGFSYHGSADFYQTLLRLFDWDFTQIQYNYVDTQLQAGEAGLVAAHAKGMGTIIMEPLRGGALANCLPPAMADCFSAADPNRTPANWGLSYLWNRSDVDLVISGMNTMAQLEENLALADSAAVGMLGAAEQQTLAQAADIYRRLVKTPCTECGYCLPECPVGLEIPDYMRKYNNYALFGNDYYKAGYYRHKTADDACIACGACSAVCPQGIDIPAKLIEMDEFFAHN